MLVIRKFMKEEIVEYVAANEESNEVIKYNMRKDGTHKANKFINVTVIKFLICFSPVFYG